MGRGGVIFKKPYSTRFRVGEVVRGFNSGPGEWHLYRNTSQMVKIKHVPRFAGDLYLADMISFVGDGAIDCEYGEDDLAHPSDYVTGEKDLKFGTRVEFTSEKRFANGSVIPEGDDTWVCATIEAIVRLRSYRVIHTNWDRATKSMYVMTSIVPFDRIRRKVK